MASGVAKGGKKGQKQVDKGKNVFSSFFYYNIIKDQIGPKLSGDHHSLRRAFVYILTGLDLASRPTRHVH